MVYMLKGNLVLIEMKCVKCNSPKILRFVDGFGDKRVFCHKCGRSFLENIFFRIAEQKNLQHFSIAPFQNYNMRSV